MTAVLKVSSRGDGGEGRGGGEAGGREGGGRKQKQQH